ncbi:MAG: aspartyl protease family protein [Bacteroidota bacterium]
MKRQIAILATMLCCSATMAQTTIVLDNCFRTLKSLKVEIENNTYNLLFDTGGGLTMISPKVIEEINRSSYGKSVGFRMSGEKVETELCESVGIRIGGISFFQEQR